MASDGLELLLNPGNTLWSLNLKVVICLMHVVYFNQRSGANFKKHVFCKILLQISCFFKLFSTKNAENDYFDQRLESAAPKRWSKYATYAFMLIATISPK